jgi:hypothetical protein
VRVVAARLRHADPSVTLRVYAHVIRGQVAEAADVFARSIPAGDQAGVSKSVSKKAMPSGRGSVDLGALGGTRTPNLLIRSQMLYPLSYERLCRNSLRHHAPRPCGADLLVSNLDSPATIPGHPADARQLVA